MTDKLRAELIQVAAVAVAIITDLDHGIADRLATHPRGGWMETRILEEISEERGRQDEKWGPIHHRPALWMAILGEEVGEALDELGIVEWTWSLQENSGLNQGLHQMADAGLDLKETLDAFYFPKSPDADLAPGEFRGGIAGQGKIL